MKYLTLVFTMLLCLSCQRQNQLPPKSTQQEYLLYISSRGEGFDIYRNDKRGQAEMILTGQPGWEWNPQVSQAQRIVIFNSQDTAGNFQQMAMDFKGQQVPFSTTNLPEFTISNDGKWAAYIRKKGEASNIVITRLSSPQDSVLVTDTNGYNGRPKWSNAGDRLAFISDRSGSNELFIYDLNSKTTRQVTNNFKREKYLSWSPDDRRIAITMRTDDTENDIYLVDLKTLVITPLTDTPINESEIAWSPNGNYLAYHAKVNDRDDIFVIDLTTKEVFKVTTAEAYHGEPTWFLE